MSRDAELTRLSSLDEPTRRALFDYVATERGPVSRDAAAAAVGVDRSVAAYHLDRLVAVGLVTASYFRPGGRGGPGAGRPAKHYEACDDELAVSVPPRDYRLAAELLSRAVEADPDPQSPVRTALESAARQLGRDLAYGAYGDSARPTRGEGQAPTGDLSRAGALAKVLGDLGFCPYEADDGAVRLRNCPFARLAQAHPTLTCGMNRELVAGLAEAGASHVAAVLEPVPGHCCVALQRR